MSEVTITVRGEHEARIAPEHAIAHVSASVDGAERGAVVERIAALVAPVRDDLTARKASGGIADWTSQRVSVWADRPWNSEGRQLDLVHHASVELRATFTDFMLLSDWLSDIASREGMQVGSVSWELAPETRARVEREVATQAVSVAVERATAYAEAIGRATLTPVEIADLGLLTDGVAPAGGAMQMMKASMGRDAVGSAMAEFHPEDIVISAGVEARFRAS
ncbi:SIMPL domain-containing protein [Microbacterium saccharophilum]|uniref:SIMPL domain-containing protein n=1 Tax=Microbacterium saccharophilum TaxID=1213358 RepID=A0A5C8I719_9MICO|nr:SIMPL domain-containing protein [Microbacterium saccharophilum]TXK14109.1 SIMPL domain-containing protein [Microbacterium saccharophilum]GEP46655.1 SIMPL domain-containing protein [Microbacterium saccharophilum]